MRRLLLLNNWNVESPPDGLEDHFRGQGLAPEAWWAGGGQLPPSTGGFDAVFLSGAPAAPWDPEPWIGQEIALIHDAVKRGLPMLGVCFGSQALAFALCGPQSVYRRETFEVGVVRIETSPAFADDPLGAGIPADFPMLTWHRDEVTGRHDDVQILGSSPDCANQIWRRRGLPVWGVQGHPEAGGPEAEPWLATHRETLKLNGLPASLADRPGLPATPDAMRLFDNFAAFVRQA